MRTYRWSLAVLSLLALSLLVAEEAGAIPAFARKYNMSCLTCHQPFPKLKAYGEDFAANGFQLPGKEPARAFRKTGDDWLLLMREVPLALRMDGFLRWRPQASGRSDFQTPYILKILSGGNIAPDVSYYFYFFFSERGEVAGIEDAFILFNNVFKTGLDVTIGQFQVSDPLFKRELRLPFEDYRIYGVSPGMSGINLTYDRGVVLSYGLPTGTDLSFQVLNGSGIGEADAGRNFDTDKYKNLMLRVSQDVVDPLRIGAFGYYGKEEQVGRVNTLWMAGPDLTLALDKVELNMQYVERRDDNATFADSAVELTTRGAFAEVIYLPEGDDSRYYGVLLWNWLEGKGWTLKSNALTGHLGYVLMRNLRLTGEYTYDFVLKANAVTVGFVSAF